MTTRRHTPPQRSWWRRVNWQAALGVLLLVAAAYIAGSTYQQGEDAQRRAECQTSLNRAFLESLQGRDRAAREGSNAQRELLATPSTASERTKAEARQRYIDALTALDRARAANPLPKETTC